MNNDPFAINLDKSGYVINAGNYLKTENSMSPHGNVEFISVRDQGECVFLFFSFFFYSDTYVSVRVMQ